jgi:hypothetical protein
MMKSKFSTILTTALAAALFVALMAGCSDPSSETSVSARTGLVNINLSVGAASARTALPAPTFTSYKLVFDPQNEDPDISLTFDSAEWQGDAEIAAASYTKLTVYGYDVAKTDITEANHIAKGESGTFTVSAGTATDVTVPLTFNAPTEGQKGTVSYKITNNSGIASSVTLVFTPFAGGEPLTRENISELEASWEDIPAGYYLAKVTLSGAGLTAVKSDVVHIYNNQTAALDLTFETSDFHSVIEDVWLVGSMANNWDPQGVLMTETNGVFTWTGEVTAGATFRFHLTDVTEYENKWYGDWFASNNSGTGKEVALTLSTPESMYFWQGTTEANWKIETLGYYTVTVDPYERKVTVTETEHVTGVTLTPTGATLTQGGSETFVAEVQGSALTNTTVTWSLTGAEKEGTAITTSGVLTIASDEPAGTDKLTVIATSNANPEVKGEAKVTVTATGTPIVKSIVVTSVGDATEIAKGESLEFDAKLEVENDAGKTVTWTVTCQDGNSVSDVANTKVVAKESANDGFDASATLTVGEADRNKELKVIATSTVTTSTSGSKTIFARKYGAIYIVGTEFGDWEISSKVEMPYNGNGVYKINDRFMTKPTYLNGDSSHAFKIVDDTATDYNTGVWFNPAGVNNPTTGVQSVTTGSNPTDKIQFAPTHGGKYDIELNTVTNQVTFASTQQVITLTSTPPTGLALGDTTTFTVERALTDVPLKWSVYGDTTEHTNALAAAGTSVTEAGLLTVGATDWVGHALYIVVESLGEIYTTPAVAVIDPKVYIVGFMNSWNNAGTEMIKGNTDATKHLFTWTGSLSDSCDFRMHRGGGDAWSRPWFAPNPTEGDIYGINSGHHENMPVIRWENASETNKKWQITSWGEGSSDYTITFNAAAKTLTVTRDNDAQ